MRLLSKKDRGCLLEFSIGFWIPGSSRVYQLVVRRRGPVEERRGRGEERSSYREVYREEIRRVYAIDVRSRRPGGGCGLKYSSQCSPGRGADTPWQLEARERHARWTHIFYPTEKPSSLHLWRKLVCFVPNGASSLPGACSRFRPHRPPAELVASVPFSRPDPIQNLRITAVLLSLSLDPRTPSRIYVTLRYVTLRVDTEVTASGKV